MFVFIGKNSVFFKLNRLQAVSVLPNFRAEYKEYYFKIYKNFRGDFLWWFLRLDVYAAILNIILYLFLNAFGLNSDCEVEQ